MKYGMKSKKGEILVDGIVNGAMMLRRERDATPEEAYAFAEIKLEILSNAEGFEEAMNAKVRETVYEAVSTEV